MSPQIQARFLGTGISHCPEPTSEAGPLRRLLSIASLFIAPLSSLSSSSLHSFLRIKGSGLPACKPNCIARACYKRANYTVAATVVVFRRLFSIRHVLPLSGRVLFLLEKQQEANEADTASRRSRNCGRMYKYQQAHRCNKVSSALRLSSPKSAVTRNTVLRSS